MSSVPTGRVQREDVVKLLLILRSSLMDLALKRCALEQLSLLLQGTAHLHYVLQFRVF